MSPEAFWVFEGETNTLHLPGIKNQISTLSTPYCNPYTVYSIPDAKAVVLFITFYGDYSKYFTQFIYH